MPIHASVPHLQLARMEADFLQSLHEVRRMVKDMEHLAAAVGPKPAGQEQDMEHLAAAVGPKTAGQEQCSASIPCTPEAHGKTCLTAQVSKEGAAKLLGKAAVAEYSPVSSRVSDLAREASTLKQLYESTKQNRPVSLSC
eukprot:1159955-Pelagomonas_calceolata.AAC.7